MSRGKPTAAERRRQLSRLAGAIERLVNEEKSYGENPSADHIPADERQNGPGSPISKAKNEK